MAPALIGGRGSQLVGQDEPGDQPGWRPPSSAGEDRNSRADPRPGRSIHMVAPALIGGRGSQLGRAGRQGDAVSGGARPHRRARIATSSPESHRRTWRSRWRPPSSAGEDRNRRASRARAAGPAVAPALIGGRGSQLVGQDEPGDQPGWRPPSSAGEDRNSRADPRPGRSIHMVAPALIGGRGSQLGRAGRQGDAVSGGARPHRRARIATSSPESHRRTWRSRWRPPSSAGEDRNRRASRARAAGPAVAPALIGGRGSQPRGPR